MRTERLTRLIQDGLIEDPAAEEELVRELERHGDVPSRGLGWAVQIFMQLVAGAQGETSGDWIRPILKDAARTHRRSLLLLRGPRIIERSSPRLTVAGELPKPLSLGGRFEISPGRRTAGIVAYWGEATLISTLRTKRNRYR